MIKTDIEATVEALRRSMEKGAREPGQDECELACNRDGIPTMLAFARWSLEKKAALEPSDYMDAVGMLMASMIVGALSAIDPEDHGDALANMFNVMSGNINLHLSGETPTGSERVDIILRDVGDA